MAGKIEKIELYHLDIPLPTALFPVWIPGYPQYRQSYTLLAITTSDGLVGYASGPAFDRERESLGEYIGQFLLGIDPYDLEVVRSALEGRGVVAIELAEVELVDRDTVMLLAQTEARGIELRSCPAYIREWITKEREQLERQC